MGGNLDEFKRERERLQAQYQDFTGVSGKRFLSLDAAVYREGVLPAKVKELMGLTGSIVLRCDDCINYHIVRCREEGVTSEEFDEAVSIALIVGGSITIPHIRRAVDAWLEMDSGEESGANDPALHSDNAPVFFDELLKRVTEIVENSGSAEAKLQAICEILRYSVPYYDWVGFYIEDSENPRTLYLGPYAGEPTEHSVIPFGRGICGRVAESGETLVIQDVTKEDNYLSCSVNVKSEIVLPIKRGGNFIAQLDIDSHAESPFSEADVEFLTKVCEAVEPLL